MVKSISFSNNQNGTNKKSLLSKEFIAIPAGAAVGTVGGALYYNSINRDKFLIQKKQIQNDFSALVEGLVKKSIDISKKHNEPITEDYIHNTYKYFSRLNKMKNLDKPLQALKKLNRPIIAKNILLGTFIGFLAGWATKLAIQLPNARKELKKSITELQRQSAQTNQLTTSQWWQK